MHTYLTDASTLSIGVKDTLVAQLEPADHSPFFPDKLTQMSNHGLCQHTSANPIWMKGAGLVVGAAVVPSCVYVEVTQYHHEPVRT